MELTEVSTESLRTLAKWLKTEFASDKDLIDAARKENLTNEQRVAKIQFWAGKHSVIEWILNEIKVRERRNVQQS